MVVYTYHKRGYDVAALLTKSKKIGELEMNGDFLC